MTVTTLRGSRLLGLLGGVTQIAADYPFEVLPGRLGAVNRYDITLTIMPM